METAGLMTAGGVSSAPAGPQAPAVSAVAPAQAEPGVLAVAPPGGRPRRLKIRPGSGWAGLNLRELWDFRDLLLILAGRDLKLRYRQTALGVAWVVLQPLLAAAIFAFVFGKVAGLSTDDLPPFLFTFAGMLGWTVFSGTLGKAGPILVANAHLVSKVYFPRLLLPLSVVLSTLVDFAVSLAVMFFLMAAYGRPPTWALMLLPVWVLLLLALSAGLGLVTSALSVSYRDVQYIVPVILQLMMYASPVAYPVSAVPEGFRAFYYLNPLAGVLEAMRYSLLGSGQIHMGHLAYSAAFAVVVLVAGAFFFRRMERRFADVI